MRMKMHAFTLVELLIVVAIIAILAAIALPNFLEAQSRSKVSRVIAEMSHVQVALEAYHVDHNRYPFYGNPNDHVPPSGRPHLFVPLRLTTPIAYMTTMPVDIFHDETAKPGDSVMPATYYYMYNFAGPYMGRNFSGPSGSSHYARATGMDSEGIQWTFWSHGPDGSDDHGGILYDPTNGTVSQGDIVRFGP